MESVFEEEDCDEENKSHFELIKHVKNQKSTIGLYHGRLNLYPFNFKFPQGYNIIPACYKLVNWKYQ